MKTSSVLPFALVALVAGGTGWFAAKNLGHASPAVSAEGNDARRIKFYQSPMHPWIKSDKPGKCTICGMDLVAVYEGEAGIATGDNVVALTPASAAVVGVQTHVAAREPLVRTVRVTGVLDDDETRHRILAARVPGRIEKLFVNAVGLEVAAGAPLATLYSPEVATAQRVYIERVKSGPDAFTASERADARERLLAFGLDASDLERLDETQKPDAMVTVRAPEAGTVVSRAAYQGQYVKTDDPLFEIGDLSTLWFIFDAYEADLGWLRVGQTVDVTSPSRPGEVFRAPITFIDPNVNEMTRTARVRVVLDNRERRLLHRQTASGRVAVESPETLVVPRSAVLHTQGEPMVYIDRGEHAYEPRTIKTGRIGDTTIEVLEGLRAGDRVVTQGALLLDGQAQLAHAAQGSTPPAAAATLAPAEPPPAPAAGSASGSMPAGHHAMAMSAPAPPPASADAAALPPALVLAAADAAAALASDDLPAYQKLLPALTAAVHQAGAAQEKLMPLAAKLVDGPDIKSARRAFEPFSTLFADLVLALPRDTRGVRVFQCPMTPVLGKGRWVQRGDDLRNPFFGRSMLTCGEAVD